MRRFQARSLPDGRRMLNLACGTRHCLGWNNLDRSPYAFLAHHRDLAALLFASRLISQHRYDALVAVDPDIMLWDLRKGIPYADGTFDVVYHSHFLEHLERDSAPVLLGECLRVLRPGGITRVVVPDLEVAVRSYVDAVTRLDSGPDGTAAEHEGSLAGLFEQMVRTTPAGTAEQAWVVRLLEGLVRGNARKAGELHRWMYDRHSLARTLVAAGFTGIRIEDAVRSRIPGWVDFHLDANADGSVHIPGSLYLEANRP